MIADLELLKKITHGAIKIEETADGFCFYRMTEHQGRTCLNTSENYYCKPFATAGVRFDFITDAKSFDITGRFEKGGSRIFAYLDVKVNGVIVKHEGTANYPENPDFAMSVELDGKMNTVSVYLPEMAKFVLKTLEFKEVTAVNPVKKDLTLVCWGDSITQGYEAQYPSLTYTNLLADALNAEMYNKAIAGEIFNPVYFDEVEPLQADVVLIAYGTNDWNKRSEDDLKRNCRAFLEKITAAYPNSVMYLIVPIWRADTNRVTAAGTFENARNIIFDICKDFSSINVIDGIDLVQHEAGFFSDKCLHPNDLGFVFMANKLLGYIKKP